MGSFEIFLLHNDVKQKVKCLLCNMLIVFLKVLNNISFLCLVSKQKEIRHILDWDWNMNLNHFVKNFLKLFNLDVHFKFFKDLECKMVKNLNTILSYRIVLFILHKTV